MTHVPEVTRTGTFDMQVCVPTDWDDERVVAFANAENRTGTANGWVVRKEGSPSLCGAPERQPCAEREGMVHIMLEC